MTRVADILVNARDSLSDPNGTRWSDARLLRLLDAGQKLIARQTRMLKSIATINIRAGVAVYELPDNAYLLTRARHDTGEVIKLRTREWMDEYSPTWETDTGSVIEFIIFDKLKAKELLVYPIPTASDAVEFDSIVSDFGVTATSTGDSLPSDFGVVGTITASATESSSITPDFGILVGQSEIAASIYVHYISKPQTISLITHEDGLFDLDEAFDYALKLYIVGHALRDDKDSQNRIVGNEELAEFKRAMEEAQQVSATDYTQQTQYETFYNGGI